MGYSWSRTISVKFLQRKIQYKSFVFLEVSRAYYRNSVGVLLIYDTTNYVSFTHVTSWLNEARAQIQPYHSVFLLVGTKIDRESERQVNLLDFLSTK
jgi:GTPase SAR1 family protein